MVKQNMDEVEDCPKSFYMAANVSKIKRGVFCTSYSVGHLMLIVKPEIYIYLRLFSIDEKSVAYTTDQVLRY